MYSDPYGLDIRVGGLDFSSVEECIAHWEDWMGKAAENTASAQKSGNGAEESFWRKQFDLFGEYRDACRRGADKGAKGHELTAMLFIGGGIATVDCCDEYNKAWRMHFYKVCFGPRIELAVNYNFHIKGVSGGNCGPDRYSGWFLELSAPMPLVPGGGIGADIGFDKGKYGLPEAPSGVGEAAVGVGSGLGAAWCHYTYVPPMKYLGCCDDDGSVVPESRTDKP